MKSGIALGLTSVSLAGFYLCGLLILNGLLDDSDASRPLTLNEMESACGSDPGGCVLSDPLDDCDEPDGECSKCIDSKSRETIEGQDPYNVRLYLGASRKICKTPETPNQLTCDEGIVVCWTERECNIGTLQIDKKCNQAWDACVTTTEESWFCRSDTMGGPTGINKTKNDDSCI